MSETQKSVQSLWQRLKELVTLRFEYTKYTVAEKLTMVLAMAALFFISVLILMIAVFFLSVAVQHWMAESIGEVWSSIIVAGFYFVLLLLLIALRKQLFINPICRFISRMML